MARPSTWLPGAWTTRCDWARLPCSPSSRSARRSSSRRCSSPGAWPRRRMLPGSPTSARSCRPATIRSRSPPAVARAPSSEPAWSRPRSRSRPRRSPRRSAVASRSCWPAATRAIPRGSLADAADAMAGRRGRRRVRPQRVGRDRPGGDGARSRPGRARRGGARLVTAPLRLGIVGTGDVAERDYLPELGRLAGRAEIVAFASRDGERARAAAARWPRGVRLRRLRGVAARPRGRRHPQPHADRPARRGHARRARRRQARLQREAAGGRGRRGAGDPRRSRPSAGACSCAHRA